MRKLLFLIAILYFPVAHAQFAPQAGVAGSTAISASDNIIAEWATKCELDLGWVNIADTTLGKVNVGDAISPIGKADNFVVSLGDSGRATVTFKAPIYNGPGPDFVIFENGFANPANPEESFMELAFVEVSSDGVNFARFQPTCNVDTTTQIPGTGTYSDASKVNNLAGKYIARWGTPFDLDELKALSSIDVNNITHIRLVDVIGDLGAHAMRDKNGNKINDPYPTPFITGGFDLDAVGVIYMKGFPASVRTAEKVFRVYPNPASDRLVINTTDSKLTNASYSLLDMTGKVIAQGVLTSDNTIVDLRALSSGIYNMVIVDVNGTKWVERVTKL